MRSPQPTAHDVDKGPARCVIRSEEAEVPEKMGMTRDPVCGMRVDPATAVAQVEFEGATYCFCSRHCADTFSLDPAKFCRHPAHHNPFRMRSAEPGRKPPPRQESS